MDKLDAYRKVCMLAGSAVLETSPKGAYTACVRRDLLNEIETALIEAGFDIPAARASMNAERKAKSKAARAIRDATMHAKFPIGTWASLYRWTPPIPDHVSAGSLCQVIEPDGTSRPRKGKPDEVYVRWNVTGEPRGWVSAYNLERRKS